MTEEFPNNPLMLTIEPHNDNNNNQQQNEDDKRKKAILLDINYHLRRINRIVENITELEQTIKDKQKEAELAMDLIEENIKRLSTDEITNIIIEEGINNLDDLIFVAKKYGTPKSIGKSSIDLTILHQLVEPLEQLHDIIGMENIKNQVVDQIIASLLNFYDSDLMFHTVIKGPPGVGKTLLSKIMSHIYCRMGILKPIDGKPLFKIVKRSDLIGKYLGHTAAKTQEIIDSCEGGVLFIDEVYSLGNNENKDSFAKECIDTLNMNLTERKNFICIIAGYPKEIEECFFAYNPGLKRRFPFNYEITSYSSNELARIFISKIHKSKWNIDFEVDELDNFIKTNIGEFGNFGGDIDNLILNCKIVHGKRVFGKDISLVKLLTMEDIIQGYNRFIKLKTQKQNDMTSINHMFI